jgi:hypothetical protein
VNSDASGPRNIDTLFFMLGRDRYGLDKKRAGTGYAELVFSHPVGYVGHVVHFGASGPQNINTQFLLLGWAWCGYHKKRAGTCYSEVVFFNPVGSGVT